MHVCSAETNPFIAAFTALFELEHVSKICKPKNQVLINKMYNMSFLFTYINGYT